MKIGVFGGTFDPVHLGHLIAAQEAHSLLSLETVLFVPSREPWRKSGKDITSAEHRLAMLRLATGGNPAFEVSMVDLEREGPSYTVDTLADLMNYYGPEEELYFIMGWDALFDLPNWKEPDRLIKMCHLVSFHRPDYLSRDLASLEESVPGITARTMALEMPQIGISASLVRERVAEGLPIKYLVPREVEAYILATGLYRKG